MSRGPKSSLSQYEGVKEILKVVLAPMAGKLGKDYDAELIISSKGNYIYHCRCGQTVYGALSNENLQKPYIYCSNTTNCNIVISAISLVGEGPRFYKIKYQLEDGTEKMIVDSSKQLDSIYKKFAE